MKHNSKTASHVITKDSVSSYPLYIPSDIV